MVLEQEHLQELQGVTPHLQMSMRQGCRGQKEAKQESWQLRGTRQGLLWQPDLRLHLRVMWREGMLGTLMAKRMVLVWMLVEDVLW